MTYKLSGVYHGVGYVHIEVPGEGLLRRFYWADVGNAIFLWQDIIFVGSLMITTHTVFGGAL